MDEPPVSGSVANSFARSLPGSFLSFPVPGSTTSSFAVYKQRLYAAFTGANPWVCGAFWTFGLINNVLYVVILSAALDLVGPALPKSIVLLADVVPSFGTKLVAPYFIHLLPYRIRVLILVALSFIGMQMVAWAGTLPTRLLGVVMASISSGLGELSFLGMSHHYGQYAIPFWSSGTGAAGLIGAALYVCATSWIEWSVRSSLMAFGFLPVIMLFAFFVLLPQDPLRSSRIGYQALRDDIGETEESPQNSPNSNNLTENLKRTRSLFFPYMLPLLLVYIGEYTINLGVAPTLLYPLSKMPFNHYRDAYPMYNTVYQLGVFISRSSTPFIRVRRLYPPSFLQLGNLAILIIHAMFNFIPSIYVIFAVIFWEGLLGGLVYVNTFAEIMDGHQGEEREFSLAACTVADSGGICIAGLLSLVLEPSLCEWQVAQGRNYCQLT
ncbi:batten's disease protein Cln3 [Geopyxis carbonaria]|nr:batten's disease protein Cln3 [Geopyxis carbonaria]